MLARTSSIVEPSFIERSFLRGIAECGVPLPDRRPSWCPVGIAPAYARLDDTRIGGSGQCWFWLVHLGLIAD
jgi:hypothetical protein